MRPDNIKSINEIKKDAIEEFVNFIKEQMPLDICSGTEACEEINSLHEEFLLNLKAKPLTNADKIKNMTNRELAKFLSDISIGYSYEDGDYIEYKNGDYIELGGNRIVTDDNTDLDTAIEEWLETGMEKENTKPSNRDTDDYER